MQFSQADIDALFTTYSATNTYIFEKIDANHARMLASKETGRMLWGKDIEWYDPEDAIYTFKPEDRIEIGKDVQDYLF